MVTKVPALLTAPSTLKSVPVPLATVNVCPLLMVKIPPASIIILSPSVLAATVTLCVFRILIPRLVNASGATPGVEPVGERNKGSVDTSQVVGSDQGPEVAD